MLYLSKEQAQELTEHSKSESPNEACGILAGLPTGKDNNVNKVYKMANADNSAATFLMDPKEQLTTLKEIRNLGLEMIGIYHSHTQTEAYPSEHDVKLAYYSEASYVIVSIVDKDTPSIRSFKIVEGKITEEEVKIG